MLEPFAVDSSAVLGGEDVPEVLHRPGDATLESLVVAGHRLPVALPCSFAGGRVHLERPQPNDFVEVNLKLKKTFSCCQESFESTIYLLLRRFVES